MCARRKEINGQSISFNPPEIDIYPQHFVPIQHGSGGFIEKKMVVSRRSCSTLYMGATFIAVDVLLPHVFFFQRVFLFGLGWARDQCSNRSPAERQVLLAAKPSAVHCIYRPAVCVSRRTIRSRFYIYWRRWERQSSYVIAAIQSRPTPLPSANVVTLCVCMCGCARGGGNPFFYGARFIMRRPVWLRIHWEIEQSGCRLALCVCANARNGQSNFFFSPSPSCLGSLLLLLHKMYNVERNWITAGICVLLHLFSANRRKENCQHFAGL